MNEAMPRRTSTRLGAVILLLLFACSQPVEEAPLRGARIGGPFVLTDQNGKTVRDRDFAGRYRLVYFGYTYCPDVCPTDLQSIGQAMRQLEKSDPKRAAEVQPIFITVDPERDTPQVLKSYVAAFHPRLIGLTGSPDQIGAVKKHFGIYSEKRPTGVGTDYFVDHSRLALLMGRQGEPIALLPQEQGGKAIADALAKWVQ